MKNFGSGGAISFHIGPIFNGRQPLEGLKLGVWEPVLKQNWTFGPILWPLMKGISTEHDNLDNFKSRGSTGFDYGAIANWKWPMESLSYHELRVKCDVFDQYTELCVLKQFRPVFHCSPAPFSVRFHFLLYQSPSYQSKHFQKCHFNRYFTTNW